MPDNIDQVGGNGILQPSDLPDLQKGVAMAFQLMKDGQWYTADDIEKATGQREGLRRMRELRDFGHTIEKRRVGKRVFQYRLIQRQQDLFP